MSGSDDRSDSGSKAVLPAAKGQNRSRSKKAHAQLDMGVLLREPLHILADGKRGKMDPREAAVRRQVQEALQKKSMQIRSG